ncbi:MAG TPA: NmrA/HSCARG family protein [Nitrospiraceae bacterium]|jgi:uncharacterized protein YbjT (DUF2867 family)|nr:NmrA/HSCARG family protein [Nitrospiraceae bacterium]
MADKPIIAVVGATGMQGNGLVQAILSDPRSGYAVRALTRDVQSDKAKLLARQGAEVVEADIQNAESLKRAFTGAYGAFCVTFYWAHMSPEKELAEAQALARAVQSAGVRHVVWSTLEDTRRWVPLSDGRMPTLMGKYKVPHFDAKGEADEEFRRLAVPTTFFLTSFYWDNFILFGMGPKKGPDGRLALTLPMGDKKLPGIGGQDIGKCAWGLFKRPETFIGKTVGVAGEHLTGTEMAAVLTKHLGQEIRYNAVSPEVYRDLGFPGADDLGNMFQFKHDFNEAFCGARDVAAARSLNPALQGFDEWVRANKDRIPLS